MPAEQYFAIIVGGGSGSRMQSDLPKQFHLLAGKPVLMHSIEAFAASALSPVILVVLNESFHEYWTGLCREHSFHIPHRLVAGGTERFFSVRNALAKVPDEAVAAIHDAVRPCVTTAIIDASFKQASEQGTSVVCVKSRDSVRRTDGNLTVSLNRDDVWIVQTPQTFKAELLKKAYKNEYSSVFTDDASVAEKSGVVISVLEGDHRNLKITYPEDIAIAEIYLSKKE